MLPARTVQRPTELVGVLTIPTVVGGTSHMLTHLSGLLCALLNRVPTPFTSSGIFRPPGGRILLYRSPSLSNKEGGELQALGECVSSPKSLGRH